MDRIKGSIPEYMTQVEGGERWQSVDLTGGGGPMTLVEFTGSYSETGSIGQPVFATAAKGDRGFEKGVTEVVDR